MPSDMPPGYDLSNMVVFGPDANCTRELCPIEMSVYKYRPNLGANVTFLVLYAVAMVVHIILGYRWNSWWFASFMVAGCLSEIIGYLGRIIMWDNPFSFSGFMLQITFITGGPVFYTAAIYVTLSKTQVPCPIAQRRTADLPTASNTSPPISRA